MQIRAGMFALIFAATATVLAGAEPPAKGPAAATMNEDQKLQQLFDSEWDWTMSEFPTWATYVGDPRFNDRLTDMSQAAIERRKKHPHEVLAKLHGIDRSKLTDANKLNYDLFERDYKEAIEGEHFPEELLPINQMGGIHSEIAELAIASPKTKLKDYEDFLKRLHQVPLAVDQTIALMKRGVAAGITPPKVTLRDVAKLIGNQLVDDPVKSPIYTAEFHEFPESVSAADQARLKSEVAKAIKDEVIPAFIRLRDYFVNDYEPHARASIAMTDLPNGKAWYAYRVKQLTTTDLTPEQIHQIGLDEVKRIGAEMDSVMRSTGFKGTREEFFKFLRTDPQFFYTSKDSLVTAYRDIAKRIDPELPKLFGRLPRLPYGVVPIPSYSEKTQTTAYYQPGSVDAHRPGYFNVNTYDLPSRPKWEMEALTSHEAVPGHHLQISLAQELGELPKFRQNASYTAFVEGWALYSESLGPEIGLYSDPYSKFGQLTYEMWRAVRLVVDTGMHSQGWTRDQALKYFRENAGKAEHDIEVEVDRYIVWPGQALAYKLGERKIKELRAYAEKELGDRFDIRAFHDEVLGAGAIPLDVLEKRVRGWVDAQKTVH